MKESASIWTSLLGTLLTSFVITIIIVLFTSMNFSSSLIVFTATFFLIILASYFEAVSKNIVLNNYVPKINAFQREVSDFEIYKNNVAKQKELDLAMINNLRKEKSKGYPALAKAYDDYFMLIDMQNENGLRYKKHPAARSADVIREEAKRRRAAEQNSRIYRNKLEYLLELFPHLSEYIDIDEPEEDSEIDPTYTEQEKQDPTTWYMPRAEWIQLPTAERGDKTLQRYWRRRKSSIEIGKMYERYIGYQFERDGYDVDYTGIIHGFEDLGRDLVVTQEGSKDVFIVQCKCWAHYKTIHVAFINQLYGTAMQYQIKNQDKNVHAVFYTTIGLDDTARDFANYLKIDVKENFPMDNDYPCIKCNVSMRTGEKIYHLPFDQQYDKTKIIEEKHEKYVSTCKEAEELGFRRAFRWHPETV